jgi:hypothetical protein
MGTLSEGHGSERQQQGDLRCKRLEEPACAHQTRAPEYSERIETALRAHGRRDLPRFPHLLAAEVAVLDAIGLKQPVALGHEHLPGGQAHTGGAEREAG